MSLLTYLVEAYGVNEPILSSEITYKDYSKPWLAKELARLCGTGELCRFGRGVYYIPTATPFGPSVLSPQKVVEKLYISNGSSVNGFYSGQTALNIFGLSSQMPNTLEVCTNNEPSNRRNIKVGNQSVILRRSRVTVTNENSKVLRFLELMNDIPEDYLDAERKNILQKLIVDEGITKEQILRYSKSYPDKTFRILVESEAIYYAAQ